MAVIQVGRQNGRADFFAMRQPAVHMSATKTAGQSVTVSWSAGNLGAADGSAQLRLTLNGLTVATPATLVLAFAGTEDPSEPGIFLAPPTDLALSIPNLAAGNFSLLAELLDTTSGSPTFGLPFDQHVFPVTVTDVAPPPPPPPGEATLFAIGDPVIT